MVPLHGDSDRSERPAYFSPRLGAHFLLELMFHPQFGPFYGATIVSMPQCGSPLQQLGLGEGDVITRLDGVPVLDVQELDRHLFATSVRFLRANDPCVQAGMLDICPHQIFVDPSAPRCSLGGCSRMVLRP